MWYVKTEVDTGVICRIRGDADVICRDGGDADEDREACGGSCLFHTWYMIVLSW